MRISGGIRGGTFYREASTAPASPGDALWVATFLPLRRWRHIIPFVRAATRIEEQLRRTAGLIRYGLRGEILHRRFWTLSAWTDRDAMTGVVRTDPHHTAVARFADWAGTGAAFVEWRGPDKDLDWGEALARLRNPTFSYSPGR